MTQRRHNASLRQLGLTLVELMVSIAIGMTVLSGVVQVLVVSKSNFVTERELAALQENARFAVKFLTDEIRMAGFTGCAKPLYLANTLNGSDSSWYLNGVGLEGFEYDAGIGDFPDEFEADVAADTDAIIIRRTQATGMRVTGHNPPSANLDFGTTHSFKPGQIFVLATPNCQNIAIFQMTGPTNNSNNQSHIVHNQGNGSATPGNCEKGLGHGNCTDGGLANQLFPVGSNLMTMSSEAYYVGRSETDNTVPALFRERLQLNTSTSALYTAAEELVQGVENMQILYGVDTDTVTPDGLANQYFTADAVTDWDSVVNVRLSLRMRSIFPVYNTNVDFGEFMGVADTDGSDRFMRQIVTTTIQIRNS